MKANNNAKMFSGSLTRSEALNCKPVKNNKVKEEQLGTGEIMLTYHINMRPWIASLARKFGKDGEKRYEKKIQLDELGTTVWELMDGKNSVHQIIIKFAEKYQIHVKESEVSVTRFLRILGKRGLIGFK